MAVSSAAASQSAYAVAEKRFFVSSRIVHDPANRAISQTKTALHRCSAVGIFTEAAVTVPRRPTMS
jgi:hypothetical protein